MSPLELRPEPAQRTAWIVQLVLVTLLALLLFMTPLVAAKSPQDTLALSTLLGVILLLALFVLAWIPLYHRSLHYEIDDTEIRVSKGVVWRSRVTVPYTKVTNVDLTQGPLERMFGIGRVKVQTAGYGGKQGQRAEQALVGLRDFNRIRDLIMERIAAHNRAPGMERKEASAPVVAGATMEKMLEELTAIRRLLEESSQGNPPGV